MGTIESQKSADKKEDSAKEVKEAGNTATKTGLPVQTVSTSKEVPSKEKAAGKWRKREGTPSLEKPTPVAKKPPIKKVEPEIKEVIPPPPFENKVAEKEVYFPVGFNR